MADLFSLLMGDDPSAEAKAQALSRLMQRRQGLGMMGQLSGDRVIAPVGAGLAAEGREAPGQIAGLMNQRQGRLIAREQFEEQKRRLDETERHNRAMESRPPAFPVIYGGGGEALRIDPRDPSAPAVPVLGPGGAPVVKPTTAAGGTAEVRERQRRMLSDGQVKILAEYDNGIAMLDEIARAKEGVDTGPLAARRNKIAGSFGLDDPKISAFRAMVGDQLAAYIRSISGAAASDRERAFLMQNIPKPEDNDETFKAKLQVVTDRLKKLREIELDLFGKQGKDVAAFNEGDAQAPRRRRYNPATGALE